MVSVLAVLAAFPALPLLGVPVEPRLPAGGLEIRAQARTNPDDWLNQGLRVRANQEGLWYGTPGVRAGEDILGPIQDLLRRPAGLLDFSPRRSPSTLDPELEEFNRRYREVQSDPKLRKWPFHPGKEK